MAEAPTQAAAHDQHVHLLVVDRDRELVELIRCALRRAGIASAGAHTAVSAVAAFADRRPRVVVLETYGLDVLQSLRACGHDAAIIVLTTCDSAGARARALGQGADDYLTKPFSCRDLLARICTHLQRTHPGGPAHVYPAETRQVMRTPLVEDDRPTAPTDPCGTRR